MTSSSLCARCGAPQVAGELAGIPGSEELISRRHQPGNLTSLAGPLRRPRCAQHSSATRLLPGADLDSRSVPACTA